MLTYAKLLLFATLSSSLVIKKGGQNNTNSYSCICVPYDECPMLFDFDNDVGILMEEEDKWYKLCNSTDYVCCPTDNTPKYTNIRAGKNTPLPFEMSSCGKHNKEGIVKNHAFESNDNEARFGEFPWIVIIMKVKSEEHVCGGSLIHPSVVLTAAHCLEGKEASDLKIRAGEHDTRSYDKTYPHQDRNVTEIVYHENYGSDYVNYDFALLKLAQPFDITEHVNVICLPDPNVNFDWHRCFVSGWDEDTHSKQDNHNPILKKIELPVIPNDICQIAWNTLKSHKKYKFEETVICAGGEYGKYICTGDEGSPLMCPIKNESNKLYQAGIVAWHVGCGIHEMPSLFANVSFGRTWIDDKMAVWGLSINQYEYKL